MLLFKPKTFSLIIALVVIACGLSFATAVNTSGDACSQLKKACADCKTWHAKNDPTSEYCDSYPACLDSNNCAN